MNQYHNEDIIQDQDQSQSQNEDNNQENKEVSNHTEQYKNIYTLIDDKLKQIQECKRKKKSKSKSVKGRVSKH